MNKLNCYRHLDYLNVNKSSKLFSQLYDCCNVPYGKYLDKNQTVKLQGLNRGSLQSGIHCVFLFCALFCAWMKCCSD